MDDRRYAAMMRAVDLARSGQYSNWWTVQVRLRGYGYRPTDLDWTERQREWLDGLCIEARKTKAD
jgi:hypothetical protein